MNVIINADGLVLGRMASMVAKKALLGHTVDVINVEKAVIVGKKDDIVRRYKEKRERGDPYKGPFIPRPPHLLAHRITRGMLPKGARGKEVLSRIKYHIGDPFGKKSETLNCHVSKSSYWKYLSLGELSVILGAKKTW